MSHIKTSKNIYRRRCRYKKIVSASYTAIMLLGLFVWIMLGISLFPTFTDSSEDIKFTSRSVLSAKEGSGSSKVMRELYDLQNIQSKKPMDCLPSSPIKGELTFEGNKVYYTFKDENYKLIRPDACFESENEARNQGFLPSSIN